MAILEVMMVVGICGIVVGVLWDCCEIVAGLFVSTRELKLSAVPPIQACVVPLVGDSGQHGLLRRY